MAGLKYSPEWYTPAHLRSGNVSVSDVRKEYTRLRDIAQKRLKRMQGTMWVQTETYQKNWGAFTRIRDMAGRGTKAGKVSAELAYKMADLARFISAQSSTITGLQKQMERSLETLHAHEYTFVNRENYIQFGKFMQEYRQQKLDSVYDSVQAADTFETLEKHRVNPAEVADDFEYWLRNQEEASQLKPQKGTRTVSAKTLKNRVEKAKKRKRK